MSQMNLLDSFVECKGKWNQGLTGTCPWCLKNSKIELSHRLNEDYIGFCYNCSKKVVAINFQRKAANERIIK